MATATHQTAQHTSARRQLGSRILRRLSELSLTAPLQSTATSQIGVKTETTNGTHAHDRCERADSSSSSSSSSLSGVDDRATGKLQDDLINAIKAKREKGGEDFLSANELKKMIHVESVTEQLLKCDRSRRKRLQRLLKPSPHREQTPRSEAEKICEPGQERNRYEKIMAILTIIEHPSRIRLFLDHGVSDRFLPLNEQEMRKYTVPRVRRLPLIRDKGTPLIEESEIPSERDRPSTEQLDACFKSWSTSSVYSFLKWQWNVVPPTFQRIDENITNSFKFTKHVLPFMSLKDTGKGGGFSEISRAFIHASDHDLTNDPPGKPSKGTFIVKKLNSVNKIDFIRELAVLRRFSDNKHNHIVSLLTAYERHNRFYFIFPVAKYNLADYWMETFPSPSDSKWAVEQCAGLAHGLYQVHRHSTMFGRTLLDPDSHLRNPTSQDHITGNQKFLYGWHGDIKPENILVFQESARRKILKLADFGLTRFSITPEVEAKRRWDTPTYRAPELHSRDITPLNNSLCDIWSLGCVYLEFVTWLLGGPQLEKEFLEKRTVEDPTYYGTHSGFKMTADIFYTVKKNESNGPLEFMVKNEVTKFFNELRGKENCHELGRAFLDLIEKDMLVVLRQLPCSTPPERKSAKSIAATLAEILSKTVRHVSQLNI